MNIEQDPSPEDAPPTWDEMRSAGLMVTDSRFDKLAVYLGGNGHLVIMSQGIGENSPHFHSVHCSNVEALVAALQAELPNAFAANLAFEKECEQGERESAAWQASHEVIDAAKAAARKR